MFCCRASSLCDEEFDYERQQERKMSKAEKGKHKHDGSYSLFRGKTNGHINANILFPVHTYNGSSKHTRPQVKHVTNVKQDVYVKLSRVAERHQLPPHIQHHQKHLQQHDQHHKQRSSQNGQMYLPGYRAKSAPYPPVDFNANNTKRNSLSYTEAMNGHNKMIGHTQHNRLSGDANVYGTSKPLSVKINYKAKTVESESDMSKSDTDSLTEQQNQALSTLDDTLNGFNMEDSDTDDKDMPKIIADILPYGEYESFNMDDNMDSSEKTGTSRTSSLSNESSINSRTGIISRRKNNDDGGSRRTANSVSFKLPEGHVDKPYSPMQVKSKQSQNYREVPNHASRDMNHPFTTICFSDEKGKVWHTGNGVLVQENPHRKHAGPFKGSFLGLFYGKYADKDELINEDMNKSKTPKFVNAIESFENLSLEGGKVISRGSITNRNAYSK